MDEMKDCIYRKEATEFIDKCLNHEEELQSVERETLIAVKKYLESIPAADVQPVKRGEWIKESPVVTPPYSAAYYQVHRCPFCKTTARGNITTKFCEECGADLRGCNNEST